MTYHESGTTRKQVRKEQHPPSNTGHAPPVEGTSSGKVPLVLLNAKSEDT